VWWAGEISAWGKGLKNIGIGEVGDTALALAARPDVVAVCGSRRWRRSTSSTRSRCCCARAERGGAVFDYQNPGNKKHQFAETARDCAFAGDTLVLVGEANGEHDEDPKNERDRLMVIESDLVAADDPAWTVAGLGPGRPEPGPRARPRRPGPLPSPATPALTSASQSARSGSMRPAASSSSQVFRSAHSARHGSARTTSRGARPATPSSPWASSRASRSCSRCRRSRPGVALPLWTFIPNDKQGLQIALAVAVGPFGEVYAGGIGGDDHPAFARIGS
jgi:hypothetical protein